MSNKDKKKKLLGKPPLHCSNSKSMTDLHRNKSKSPKKRSRSASPLKRLKEEEKITDKDLRLDKLRPKS
tara:strand:- start:337 stop:543 length:207 start_codon:yes stop_codon:yes gene_type:complete